MDKKEKKMKPGRKQQPHETVDFDELNRLADKHLPVSWRRVGEVEITCSVSQQGTTWVVTVRARSDGGGSRHIWFHDRTMLDAVNLAKQILAKPWGGWRIYE